MKRLVLIAALALGACVPRPAPEPITRTIRVEVPIPVPCDAKVDRNDVDIAPMIRAAADVLGRTEIVLDFLDYVIAQRDLERAALDQCRGVTNTPN